MQETALAAYQAIGCADFSRIDFILDEKNNPFVLEINTIPGFTATSLLPKAAAVAGYTFPALCLKIIQLAYAKKARVPSAK
jgi:D-alanine-D-alanine ligase